MQYRFFLIYKKKKNPRGGGVELGGSEGKRGKIRVCSEI